MTAFIVEPLRDCFWGAWGGAGEAPDLEVFLAASEALAVAAGALAAVDFQGDGKGYKLVEKQILFRVLRGN